MTGEQRNPEIGKGNQHGSIRVLIRSEDLDDIRAHGGRFSYVMPEGGEDA